MSHFSRVLYTMIASLLLVIPFVTHGQQEAPADSDAQVLCTVTTLVYDEYINAQLDYQEALSAANYSLAATSLTLVNDIRSLYCPDAGPFVTLQPDNFPAECMGYMQMLLSNYKRQLNGGSIGSANQLRSDIEALLLMPDCTELITTVAPSQDPNTLQALLSTEHQAASSQERALVDIQNNMCFLPFAQTYPQQIASIIDDNMLDNVSTMIDGLAQTNNSLPTRLAQMRQGQILQYAKSVVDYEKLKRGNQTQILEGYDLLEAVIQGVADTSDAMLAYNVMPYVLSSVQNNLPYMQEYMAAIQQVYSDYNIQNPVDFLANIPNAVYVWDADLQVFVAQAAQEGHGMVFFFPSDPVEAPESNDIALRLAYTELIQLKQPGELVDRDGIIQQEETNLFDTHFPTAVGIQVLHGTTPLLALEIDMTYDPDHIMPVVGTATVFLDPYHMQLGFTLNNIVDTSTMLIDVSLDLRGPATCDTSIAGSVIRDPEAQDGEGEVIGFDLLIDFAQATFGYSFPDKLMADQLEEIAEQSLLPADIQALNDSFSMDFYYNDIYQGYFAYYYDPVEDQFLEMYFFPHPSGTRRPAFPLGDILSTINYESYTTAIQTIIARFMGDKEQVVADTLQDPADACTYYAELRDAGHSVENVKDRIYGDLTINFGYEHEPAVALVNDCATQYGDSTQASGSGDDTTPSNDVDGCTDEIAINYDPTATRDDGTCNYGEPSGSGEVLGCTDPYAPNFNSEATQDDGSCTY